MSDSQKKRLVLCIGAYCNTDRRAKKLYVKLQPLVDKINGDTYPPPIKLEVANCLSMCGCGPNIIIYPDEVIFHDMDERRLQQLVDDYLYR